MNTESTNTVTRIFHLVLSWFKAGLHYLRKHGFLTFLGALCLLSCILASCNVTRTVTTKSEYMQRGDTSIIIQTKTIESYDGSRK